MIKDVIITQVLSYIIFSIHARRWDWFMILGSVDLVVLFIISITWIILSMMIFIFVVLLKQK